MPLLERNKVILVKNEATPGEDASPSASSDALKATSVGPNVNPNLLETGEFTGQADRGEFFVGGSVPTFPLGFLLRGGGDAATPPECDAVLKSCGFARTNATALSATATGGTTTTVTVDKSVDTDFAVPEGSLVGKPIKIGSVYSLIRKHEVSGDTVTFTLGSTLDTAPTTEAVEVPAHIFYAPLADPLQAETSTIYLYESGLLTKFLGGLADLSIEAASGGFLQATATFRAALGGDPTDVAVPTPTYQATNPGVWRNGIMAIDGAPVALQSLSLALNNQVATPDDPNAAEGFGSSLITERDVQGAMNPQKKLAATQSILADFRAGTKRGLSVLVPREVGGSLVPGQSVGITIPYAKYRDEGREERQGLMAVTAPFSALNPSGDDATLGSSPCYICFF